VAIDAWAWLYAVMAPLVAMMAFGIAVDGTAGGGDYCDPIYRDAAARDADFGSASTLLLVTAGAIGVLGLIVVTAVLRWRTTISRGRVPRLVLAVMVVVASVALSATVLVVGADFSSTCA
jgi:hypothetical protein